jgi:hypothetical protein
MKPFALATLAGASCSLIAHNLAIQGNISIALLAVAIAGAVSGAVGVSMWNAKRVPPVGQMVFVFVAGAFISEVIMVSHYYLSYGYRDPKLGIGIGIAVVEFGATAVVGSLAMSIAAFAGKRIAPHSSGSPPSASDS